MYIRGNSLDRFESELSVGRKIRRCSISNRTHIIPYSYLYFYLQIHFYVIFFVRFLPFPSKSKKGYVTPRTTNQSNNTTKVWNSLFYSIVTLYYKKKHWPYICMVWCVLCTAIPVNVLIYCHNVMVSFILNW